MLLLLLLFPTSSGKGINAEIDKLYEDIKSEVNVTWAEYIFDESDVRKHSEVKETLQHYRNCHDREWSCDKRCRLEFRSETQLCRAPLPGDNCFGIPITYKYSRDFELIKFPRELAVLSRYPRCWAHLAPIICVTLYRPCSRHLFIEKDDHNNVKNGSIELWQLLSLSLCETAYRMCADIVSSGLFPSMINCEERKENSQQSKKGRVLYSSACQPSTNQIPLSVSSGACPWPLVSVDRKLVDADNFPVLDSCYLPCRSPLISPYLSSRFRTVRFIICSLLAVVFVAESIYLSRFSKTFSESSLVFCVSHAMVSIAVYFLVWGLSVFEKIFILADCAVDGISRRQAISHSAFEWCSLQSFVVYAAFFSAFLWLLILYTNTVCPPYFLGHLLLSRSPGDFRPMLILTVYGFSTVFSAVLMNNLRENDGVTGICHVGLMTWWKYSISLLPLLFLFLLLVAIGAIVILKQDDLLRAVATQQTLWALNSVEQKGYRSRLTELKEDCNAAETQEFVNGGKKSIDSEMDPSCAVPTCKFNYSKPVKITSNWKEIYTDLLSKDYVQYPFEQRFDKCYHSLIKRMDYDRNFGLSSIWTVTSFVLVTVFFSISPIFHYLYVNVSSDHEIKSVVEYVNCGTAHAINNHSIEWKSHDAWPSPAAMESSSCSLPFKEAQGRLESVFTLFIMLPALPFVVLLLAFLTGAVKVRGVCVNAEISEQHGDEEECFGLVPVGEQKSNHITSIHNVEVNKDLNPQGENVLREEDASSVSNESDRFSTNVINDESNEVGPDDKENSAKSEDIDDTKQFDSHIHERAYQELSNIVNQLRGELVFQQSMLINDSAAWNICLSYMQKTEQCLLQMSDQRVPVNVVNQGLRSLFEDLLRVRPTISEHAIQLWRLMKSVKEASLKLDYLQGIPNDHGRSHSVFESQDIGRQHNLLALSNYLLRCQSRNKENPLDMPLISRGDPLTNTEKDCSLNKEQSSKTLPCTQQINSEKPSCIPSTSRNLGEALEPNQKRQLPIGQNENIGQNQQPSNNVSCGSSEACVPVAGRSHQTQKDRAIPKISAYAGSYSATPRGISTRLSLPELRLRVQQIQNICAGEDLYPQELAYMLLVTGDITHGGSRPQEGQFYYTMEQLPRIFGTRVPTIDARVGVQDFLANMRRRALTVVGAVGYHFSLHTDGGTSYTPPVLPPLGLYRSENELVIRRILGDREDVLPSLRDFLREFQYGRGPINPRPDLKLAFSFRNYLAMVATREGFNNDHYEEYVTDPVPPTETSRETVTENGSDVHGNENDGRDSEDSIEPAPP